jgi:hypothetical protein
LYGIVLHGINISYILYDMQQQKKQSMNYLRFFKMG